MDGEEAEAPIAFFASVIHYKNSCSLYTQSPELEDRDRRQNEIPTIQGQMVNDLLHHLDTQKTMGLDRIQSKWFQDSMFLALIFLLS